MNGDRGVDVFDAVTFEASVRLNSESTRREHMTEVRAREAGDWNGRRKRSAVSMHRLA